MHQWLKIAIVLLMTSISGIVGAISSKHIKDGGSMIYYFIFSSWVSPLSWALFMKVSPWNMLMTSAIWTVFYEICWMAVTIRIDNLYNFSQIVGSILVVLGLFLLC